MLKILKTFAAPVLGGMTAGSGVVWAAGSQNPSVVALRELNKRIKEAGTKSPKYLVNLDLANSEIVNNMYKILKDKKFTHIALTSTSDIGDGNICSNIGFTSEDAEWKKHYLTVTGWNSKTSSSNSGAKCIEKIKNR